MNIPRNLGPIPEENIKGITITEKIRGISKIDDSYLISNRIMHISVAYFNIEHPRMTHMV